jgi:hypothetical protein
MEVSGKQWLKRVERRSVLYSINLQYILMSGAGLYFKLYGLAIVLFFMIDSVRAMESGGWSRI